MRSYGHTPRMGAAGPPSQAGCRGPGEQRHQLPEMGQKSGTLLNGAVGTPTEDNRHTP